MHFSKTNLGFYDRAVHGDSMPDDAVEIDGALYQQILQGQAQGLVLSADQGGYPVLLDPPPPSSDVLQARFTAAIQLRLDNWARTRNYDGILSACTYATSSVPQFAAEGTRAVLLRDQTWAVAYDILAAVLAGTRPMPTDLADIEGDLPALEWPQ